MKVTITDDEVLAAVSPLDLTAYLRAAGWREVAPDAVLSVWELPDGQVDVEVPREPSWRDYGRRVATAIATLSIVESRSEIEILSDVGAASSDVLRFRAEGDALSDGSILLEDGVRLATAAEKLFVAAACAAIEPKRAYHSRRPRAATDFASGLRMAQTERGSFILAIRSRVPPKLSTSQLTIPGIPEPEESHPTQPFERQVTERLALALHAAQEAAAKGVASGTLDAFEAAVSLGVSADLCEALGSVGDCKSILRVSMRLRWASSRPGRLTIPLNTAFAADTLAVLREAARVLRERATIDGYSLDGWVIELSRPDSSLRGVATVLANIDSSPRKVDVELWGDAWSLANEAMTARSLFHCTGDLQREVKKYALQNPTDVRIVSVGQVPENP